MAVKKRRRGPRIYPDVRIRKNVRNESSRNVSKPDLIVVHTTESHNRPGLSDLQAIANWFDDPSAQASSHVVTDADGTSARLVSDEAKAWAQSTYNSRALSIEQIGFAATGNKAWLTVQNRRELRETARWIAHWSNKYGIPIKHVNPAQSGVVGHVDLGQAGGGHHDPGPNYPWEYVLAKARLYKRLQRKK